MKAAHHTLVKAAHTLVVGKNTERIVNAAGESTERTQISAHWAEPEVVGVRGWCNCNGCDASHSSNSKPPCIRPSSALPNSTTSAFMFPSPLLFKSYSPFNHPTSGWDKGPRLSSHQAIAVLMITGIQFTPATLVVCTQRQLQMLELGHAFGLSTLAANSSVHIQTLPIYP